MIDFILGAKEMMDGKADSLAGFKVIDKYKFSITLESPYAAFVHALANEYLGIVPKHAREAAGDRWGIDTLVGTGPFILESFDPETKIVMKPNPNYNHNVYNGRTLKPNVDGFEFYNMDENTRYLEFEAGNIDYCGLGLTMAQQYLSNPDFADNVKIQNSLSQVFFVMNNGKKPFDNPKVREAVAYAFDNDKISREFFKGLWPAVNTILPEGVPGYDPNLPGFEYNPEKAKALLAEAGYPDGIEFEMTCVGTGTFYQVYQIMQQDFAACNMTAKIDQVESGVWFDKRTTGNVQSFLGDWGPSFPNADTFMYGFFHSSAADFLSTGHRNPEFDRKVMQIIFQDPYASLDPRMTVGEIIAEPIRIQRTLTSEKEILLRVLELMDECGLERSYFNRYPHEFSGGQRQRIGIARALSVNPKLIVCDEPVSALDVSIQAQIINLLRRIQEHYELSLVFVSHDLAVVHHISDRVAVMYLGKIVELGDKKDVYRNPLHPYTKALLSSVPKISGDKGERIRLEGDMPSPVNPPSGCAFHTRCPVCQKRCGEEEPKLREVEPGHWVSCLLV